MKKIVGYIFAIVILQLFLTFLKRTPYTIEKYYSSNFYLAIQTILTYFNKWTKISIGDVLYVLVVIAIIYKIIQYIRKKEDVLKNITGYVLQTIFQFILFFQIFWGLNNLRVPVSTKLEIDTNYELAELYDLTEQLIQKTNALQYEITKNDSAKVDFEKDLKAFNKASRNGYKKLEDRFDIALIIHSDVKKSLFSSFLTGAGFSGYLNPFTHEAQVNYDIPVIGMPVTVAHEIAHQKGIATESEANFFGFLAMNSQEEIDYQYAANLYALKYCLKEVRINNEEKFLQFYDQLNFGIQENISDSEKFWQENKNFSSNILKNVYGNFLKLNNQKDGIRSYNRFVDLLINYNKKYPLQ